MTMASVGSAVQAACRRARAEALASAGGSDLTEAMRRLGQPVEAPADVTQGDVATRFAMHAVGGVFVEAPSIRTSGRRACDASWGRTGPAAS